MISRERFARHGGAMNRLVLFITEGKSEENALYSLMKSFFRPNPVIFHIYHGDPLIKRYRSGNPLPEIDEIVRYEMRKYGVEKEDIRRVIQSADTDGLFIPDDRIIMDPSTPHAIYTEDRIMTPCPDSIADRNNRRRKNIRKLIEARTLPSGIPFSIFYLSRNIEHALYGIVRSVNDNRKTDLAYDFADSFGYDWQAFISYIEENDLTIGNDYKESWKLIQNNIESLRRHTNMIYLFNDND